jgi:aspartate/methionine/tyrosine aminotransferase
MREFDARNQHFDALVNEPGLMWLGQNTNHFKAHPAVVDAMMASIAAEEFHAYAPPAGLEVLRHLILEDLGLDARDAAVLVTDGGVEALYTACRDLCRPGDKFVTTDPGWKWPMAFAKASGATVVEIPIYNAENGYKLTVRQLEEAVDERTRIIYLVDPNNPLGTCHTADEIRAFTDIARRHGAYFIHDCTYFQFAPRHTRAATFYPERTITIYSFSKWLGLAGMRVGALVADPEVLESLAAAPPNNLGSNIISQRAAIAGLKVRREWMEDVNRRQRRNQLKIREATQRVAGLRTINYPSDANLMVIECIEAGITPEALCHAFREERIMIRQGKYHTTSFGHRFVKVSTTVPEEWADAFCDRLPAMVERARELRNVPALF